MIRVGITGGIGSGKSVVCQYFESQHIPVYYADKEAGLLIDTDPNIRRKIIARFGKNAYTHNKLNKPFIRAAVFNNQAALTELNAITHPPVLKHFDDWCVAMKKNKHAFVVKEAALVFESDSHKSLDLIACVVAPMETRIDRVMQRDHTTKEQVENIIKKQLSDEEKIKRSAFVLHNGNNDLLLPQLVQFHQFILEKSVAHGN